MTPRRTVTRRAFVRSILASGAVAAVSRRIAPAHASATMPARALGRTGHSLRVLGLGGQAILEQEDSRDESIRIIHRALDLGVNYIDTSPLYGNGASEARIGEVMRSRRREVFLASKTHDRSYDGAMRHLEASLERLGTDHLDLWQLHNVKSRNDLDFIFSRQGAARALQYAREQRMVRFVGITAHTKPLLLREAIERHPFDAVLMALNAADRHDESFVTNVLPIAVERRMGIVGMKVPCRGRIFREGGITTMEQAMRYVLTLPVSAVVVGMSTIRELEENVAIARRFRPCTQEEMAALEDLTRPYFTEALGYRAHE